MQLNGPGPNADNGNGGFDRPARAMTSDTANGYLRTKILTATPEQLQMMLYDGAIRFCTLGREALANRNWEQTYNHISRAQKIILEMNCALKHDVAPDLCAKLAGIYSYVYRLLMEANIQHRVEAIDEAISLLQYQRETWAMLLGQLGRQKAAEAAGRLDVPAPSEQMEAGMSMQA